MELKPEITLQIREISRDIANKTALSLKTDLPLFIIVYYDHEADKLDLQASIRKVLKEKKSPHAPLTPKEIRNTPQENYTPCWPMHPVKKACASFPGCP